MSGRICNVDGCEKPVKKGHWMCSMHVARVARYGSTDARRGSHGTLAERYERFVVRNAIGCWAWSGGVTGFGYGSLGSVRVHRLAFELFVGPIPAGLSVLHRCDNPPCTNPAHLFLGTHGDNMADAARKGRLDGSPARGHKITIEQAREIRSLRAQGISRREISEQYGIHVDNVGRIANGKMWASA